VKDISTQRWLAEPCSSLRDALSGIAVLLVLPELQDMPPVQLWLNAVGCSFKTTAAIDEAILLTRRMHFDLVFAFEISARSLLDLVRTLATSNAVAIAMIANLDDADAVVELQELRTIIVPRTESPSALYRAFQIAIAGWRSSPMASVAKTVTDTHRVIIDEHHGILTLDAWRIRLTPRILKIAIHLLAAQGRPISAGELASSVLERRDNSAAEAVRGAIRELRLALRETPLRIETIRGYGYVLPSVISHKTHVRISQSSVGFPLPERS
jgi:DNA-binding response OmpR family regulator